jgi:hypothetical protein
MAATRTERGKQVRRGGYRRRAYQLVTGTETLQRSVMQAIGELDRLDAFVSYDKLGNKRTWTPEGYVKMVVRDNQRRASTATMFQAAAGRRGQTSLKI